MLPRDLQEPHNHLFQQTLVGMVRAFGKGMGRDPKRLTTKTIVKSRNMRTLPFISCTSNGFNHELESLANTGKEFRVINFRFGFDKELCLKTANEFGYNFNICSDFNSALFLKERLTPAHKMEKTKIG